MTMMTSPRSYRGVSAVRADASDPNAILAELNRAVAAMREKNDEALKAKVDDVVLTEHVDRINASVGEIQRALDDVTRKVAAGAINGDGSPQSPARREYKASFLKFFREGAEAGLGDLAVKAGLTTQSKPDGGYLVPTEMEETITRVLGTVSALRSLATVRTVGTGAYKRVVNIGGTGTGWAGEEETRPETASPGLRELDFPVMELYANPYATQGLLDDAMVDIEAWLADEVATVFAEQEGAAFVSGNGVRRPRGFLSYETVANASYAWGKLGFTVTGGAAGFAASNPGDAFMDLFYSLKGGYRTNGTWLTSDAVMPSIRKFKNTQGDYIWAPPALDMSATILGKPVVTDDNMPALGANAFPVAFGDFRSGYVVVDRVGIRTLRDPYSAKPYVTFYVTKRVGGGVQNFEAIKLLKCST